MWHSIYTTADGIFTGAQVFVQTGPGYAERLAACTPVGCAALVGQWPHDRLRLDLQTQQLVAYQPPAPADDAMQTWAWDAGLWRWVATPTAAAVAMQVRAERDRLLAACDWRVARATETGVPLATAWVQYRQALRDVPEQPGFPHTVTWPALPAA